MPLVNVPAVLPPLQIEVTGKASKKPAPKEGDPQVPIERSCEGSIHLRPGPTFLTRDEMDFLKKVRPEIHSQLQFIALVDSERTEIQQSAPKEPAAFTEEIPAPATQASGAKGKR